MNNSSPDHIYKEGDFVLVQLAEAVPQAFTYRLAAGQQAVMGTLVEAPLGNKKMFGAVVGSAPAGSNFKIKDIISVLDHPPLSPALLKFINWVADYCMVPVGNVLAMVTGGQSIKPQKKPRKEKVVEEKNSPPQKPVLSEAQREAANTLISHAHFAVTLLDGVTGSGKTEVFCEAIDHILKQSKQALVMLPEIALTAQITDRLHKRFGFAPTLWHSNLTPAQRRNAWKRIASGVAKLVIGARSALFLPYAKLGIIVVDEEHDGSYKQDEGVTYHARDMAVVRGKLEDIPVILSSATPSVETWVNVKQKKYGLVHLPERHGEAVMPEIATIDLRQQKMARQSWISPALQNEIKKTLAKNEQVLLFLNRRGYAPLTLCRKCGHRFSCPQCSSWLVEHRQHGKHVLACHHCDYAENYPTTCPACKTENMLTACGPGVERVQEEVKKLFPDVPCAALTSDNQDDVKKVIAEMEDGKIKILIGTQLVAKGYHFPKLTLVGVVDGDLGLQGADLRAAERTFQLLTQVSGRSGRAESRGHVFIQTTQPEHKVITSLIAHNRDGLLDVLAKERETYAMPPFARLATVTLSGTKKDQVEDICERLAASIPSHETIEVLGPAPAPMAMLRGRYRLRFLVKAQRTDKIQAYINDWLLRIKIPKTLRVLIDIDPYQFM